MSNLAFASGLVYNSTSVPATSKASALLKSGHLVDAVLNRIRKTAHSVKTTARLHNEECASSGFRFRPAMITCTYAADKQWSAKDITRLIHEARRYLQRRYNQTVFRYTWVAELQERGMIHYHIVLWLPVGARLPKPDKRGWWTKGSTRIEWARNAVGYLAKYASKMEDKNGLFPKGARISGFGGLAEISRREYRFWRSPLSIRAKFNPNAESPAGSFDIRKCTSGYFNKDTGEFYESDYAYILINGSAHIVKKEILNAHRS